MSATSTVLGLPETLQQILSELPPFDIIRCQRVNRTWHRYITDSPLLQYKAWLRNDYPDPIHHVKPDDLMVEDDSSATKDYETKRYLYNIAKHLNPVIVARIMEDVPRDPRFSFEPDKDIETHGFGGYFNFRPVLLQALVRWYNANKTSESKWSHLSLFRPEARRIAWEVPSSDDSSSPFRLEAKLNDDLDAKRHKKDYMGHDYVVNKRPGEPLFLTLDDLLANVEHLWEHWLDSERETHYLSHDSGGCDSYLGLPDSCISSNSDEENDEDEDEEMEEFGGKDKGCESDLESVKKLKRDRLEWKEEYYIDCCVRKASG
jgi:hypothetical protein